jgi:hypothetical protein
MRISTKSVRPTVSIQNGLPIDSEISRDSVRSSSEKNGFSAGGGSGCFGSTSMVSFRFSRAMRFSVVYSGSCG